MSYAIGHLLRFTVTRRDTRFQGVFKNIVNFRVLSGEVPSEEGVNLIQTFASSWMNRMNQHLCEATYIKHVRLQNLSNAGTPDEERFFEVGEVDGQVVANDDDVPQASCCFVRRTYINGRKGIGRYFHGPLPSSFTSEGEIVVDPVGLGDLNDVCDALGDPMTYEGAITLRPVVVAADATTATVGNDMRKTTIAPLTVYLKSRRAGVGE